MTNKTVAILGCNSFLGSWAVDGFLSRGYRVIGVMRSEKNKVYLPYVSNERYHNLSLDFGDINKNLNQICDFLDTHEPQIVINYVALAMVAPSWQSPSKYFQTNSASLSALVHHLSKSPYLEHFIQCSTPEVYGNVSGNFKETQVYIPSTPYGASKAAFDMYLNMMYEHFGFPVTMFRAANCYGSYQQPFRVIPKAMIMAKKGEKFPLEGGGQSKRYFIHISDVTDAVIKIAETEASNQIYHLSTDAYFSIKELVKLICKEMRYDFNDFITIVPDRVGKDNEYKINCDKAKLELEWKPQIDIKAGLSDTLRWVDRNWEVLKNEPLDYTFEGK